MLSRRRFLGGAGGVAVGGAVGAGLLWPGLLRDHVPDDITPGPDSGAAPSGTIPGPDLLAKRVLVVVQLTGGNDGLNTLVPVGDGRYHDARPTLAIRDSEVLRLTGTDHFGFHPALAPLVPRWDQGHMAAIEAIGFPDQSRSHFTALDTWWSATPKEPSRTGWLGRWLDATAIDQNPMRAIALGGGSPALAAESTLSTVIVDPATFTVRTPEGSDRQAIIDAFLASASPLVPEPTLAASQRAVPAAIEAVELLARVSPAADLGLGQDDGGGVIPPPTRGGESTSIAELLVTAARIIELDIGTRIVLVAGNGFDTHADQADRHERLLTDLAAGLAGFLDAVEANGRGSDVLVLTTSEFGRRVQENGSGTDHGNGSVQFLVGSSVKGAQIVGDADLNSLDLGDLRSTIDSRSAYAVALDWLSGRTGPTDSVLGGTFDRYDLVR